MDVTPGHYDKITVKSKTAEENRKTADLNFAEGYEKERKTKTK